MQSFIESKNINVSFDNKPNRVYVDKNMLSTIVRNLLSNAIKYTEVNGSVKIELKTIDNLLEVKVSDTGVGMTKEFTEKLFCIDYISPTLGTQKEKGTGLGLLLCKDFIIKNGGNIWVDSELGKGSSFYFTVPIAQN
jgi:two-component system, sensor histidine kinase and response regulator